MKIAIVSQEFPPETAKGGIGSQAWLKARGLAARGHHVHVISRALSPNRSDSVREGFAITRIPGLDQRVDVHTEIADWIGYSTQVAAVLGQLHAHSPFDLIEFPEWGAEGFVHLLNRSPWNHTPVVIQLHGPLVMFAHSMGWPDRQSDFFKIGSAMESTCLRLADRVYSSSRCSALWVAGHYNLDADAIPTLHSGVDTNLFTPQPDLISPVPRVFFAGRLSPNKGALDLALAAARLLPHFPALKLCLAGHAEPSVLKKIRQIAANSPNPDFIELPGYIPRDQLPAQMNRAWVFAAPSVYEGGPGFVYLEAMACGLPVIACEGSGAAEALQGHGSLVPPGDIDALTASLKSILANPAQRESVGKNNRAFVLAHANAERAIPQLETFYQSVVAKNRFQAAL